MSAATVEDFGTPGITKGNQELNNERARILNTVSRKAQEQTLTLEETTALYEKFNETYSAYRSNKPHSNVDESWALQLLQECEQEDSAKGHSPVQTRINGIPHQVQKNTKASNTKPSASANDDILVADTPELGNLYSVKKQDLEFDIRGDFSTSSTDKRYNAFAGFLIASSLLTVGALLGFSIFF